MLVSSTGRVFAACFLLSFVLIFATSQAALALAGPAGWQAMCARSPELCNTRAAQRAPGATAQEMNQLNAINDMVNAAIHPRNEAAGADVWTLSPRSGDCDDYAVTKKWTLLRAGWREDRLRFATMLTETNEMHVVLTVDTAQGMLILDNRSNRVATLRQVEARGYHLLAVEGEGPGGSWKATRYAGIAALLLASAR